VADEQVNFILAARDNATATVRRLKGELNTMGGAAAKTAGPLGRLSAVTGGLVTPTSLAIGGTVALGAAFLGAARAAMDEERGMALLTTAIKENDPAMAGNIEKIEATIRERQKLAFADDEQRESLGALVAITRDSNKALDLQRTAMDLARLKGMSLADATNLIGKVYGGNIGILSRYGIQLERGTSATEAIAEIQRRAAGQAEAYADTTAGAMESMGLVFDDVVEDIGAQLLPALTTLAIFARDQLIPALRGVGDVLGPIVGFIGNVVGAMGGLGTAATEMAATVDNRIASLKGAAEMHMPATVEAMRAGLALGGSVIAAEAGKIAGMLPSEISARVEEIREAGRNNVVQFAAGMLDKQNDPMLAMEALAAANEQALTRGAEIARLKGQLTSAELAAGLTDEREAVRLAAQAARLEITSRLEALGVEASGWGANIGSALGGGLDSQYGVVRDAAGRLAGAVRGQIGIRSEPSDPSSPLHSITEWGGNIAKTLAGGALGELRSLRGAAGAMAGAMVPAFGGAMAPAFAGGAGGATVIHTHLYLDGKEVAENVTRHQHYMNPGGPSVLPRGS
jgi:hypothetical protein